MLSVVLSREGSLQFKTCAQSIDIVVSNLWKLRRSRLSCDEREMSSLKLTKYVASNRHGSN